MTSQPQIRNSKIYFPGSDEMEVEGPESILFGLLKIAQYNNVVQSGAVVSKFPIATPIQVRSRIT